MFVSPKSGPDPHSFSPLDPDPCGSTALLLSDQSGSGWFGPFSFVSVVDSSHVLVSGSWLGISESRIRAILSGFCLVTLTSLKRC
jgi:hypothetical protein